jgi:hypothetical protein
MRALKQNVRMLDSLRERSEKVELAEWLPSVGRYQARMNEEEQRDTISQRIAECG